MLNRAEHKYTAWECLCDCGTRKTILGNSLLRGVSKSCGCLRKEITSKNHKTHGMTGTKIYWVWFAMLERCKKNKRYSQRGISVCEEWQTFDGFWKDMGSTYIPGLSIDRINNNGNYERDNCRWASSSQQQRNKATVRIYSLNNESGCLSDWSERLSIDYNWLRYRLSRLGWTLQECIDRWEKFTGKKAEKIG